MPGTEKFSKFFSSSCFRKFECQNESGNKRFQVMQNKVMRKNLFIHILIDRLHQIDANRYFELKLKFEEDG